jgi:DNA modification methylase
MRSRRFRRPAIALAGKPPLPGCFPPYPREAAPQRKCLSLLDNLGRGWRLQRCAGVNTFRAGRLDELQCHPTVKPVALVADAMRDCSRRGDIVLDLFGGSGTALLAAERVGRRAYTLEIEPRFVDVAIKRWQTFSGKDAICAETGLSFDEIASSRTMVPAAGPAPTDVR